MLGYCKLSTFAYEPVRGSPDAAGLDLRSAYDYTVEPENRILVKTDLAITLPKNTYGRIAPRSGLALHNFIGVGAGVIDCDYTGNIGIVVFNHSKLPFTINRGDKIAQLICEKIVIPVVTQLKNMPSETERGNCGFGSTGINTQLTP